MPKSKKRKKRINHSGPKPAPAPVEHSPRWWAPVMVTLMVVGLVLIVLTYLLNSQGSGFPVPGLGQWNLAIGFGVLLSGFLMTMGWK